MSILSQTGVCKYKGISCRQKKYELFLLAFFYSKDPIFGLFSDIIW